MAGARNSLKLVRRLVEAQTTLRKSERKLKRQESRVVARRSDQKLAKAQFTSACRVLKRSRNRLNKIAAVNRSNKEALDQLSLELRSFPTISVSCQTEVEALLHLNLGWAGYMLCISRCPLGERESLRQFCELSGFEVKRARGNL